MIDETPHPSGHDHASTGAWHDVAEALGSLGATISRATTDAVADDENRRRMRELSEGLTVLAGRLAEAAGDATDLPVARIVDRAAAAIDEPVSEAGMAISAEVEKLRPAALEALRLANQKFKEAEAEGDRAVAGASATVAAPAPQPVAAETLEPPASITGRFAAVVADKVGSLVGSVATAVGARPEPEPEVEEPSIQEWLFPEGASETELQIDTEIEEAPEAHTGSFPPVAPVASGAVGASEAVVVPESVAPAPEAAEPVEPVAPTGHAPAEAECADAVRVAHERFLAERKLAEEAAAASLTRARAEHPRAKRRRPAPSDDDATLW